jgi:DNA-binding NarL/FixJ family response regulator
VTSSNRKRILIADDHAGMLDEVSTLLKEEYDVVAQVTDGAALVEAATRLDPDLIISDISMPVMNGFEAAAELRRRQHQLRLIFLTVQSSPAYLKKARALGVLGYVLKMHTTEQLRTAVKTVLEGQTYFSPELNWGN